MSYNKYVGHPAQICGVEEVTLTKGKGKGMNLLLVRNGKGLDITLCADRCMDIYRISFCGDNMGYFGAPGYVAPAYHDSVGTGFLKSFTGGFLTTCGLTAVGSPCNDDGEELPLHGFIGNTPSESYYYFETDTEIVVNAVVREAEMFGRKMLLNRKYTISKTENLVTIEDSIENAGCKASPCMILYHFNMGYPLLSENAKVYIPSISAKARNAHAEDYFDTKLVMEKPQSDYVEMCFFYDVKEKDGMAHVGIYNPDINKGMKMSFDKSSLDCFTQWKMMGEVEYVLGLEPGNCNPDGRDVMRKEEILKFVEPGKCYNTKVELRFTQSETETECL